MTERKSLILSYNREDASDSLIIKDPNTRRVKAFDLKQNISSITEEFFEKESFYNGYVLFTKTPNNSNLGFQKNNIYKVTNGIFRDFPYTTAKLFKSFQDIKDFFDKDYWELFEIESNPPFYNGKILFLDDDGFIKKNKIYKVRNGIFTDERGLIVPYLSFKHPFASFKDIQDYFAKDGSNPSKTSIVKIIEVQE